MHAINKDILAMKLSLNSNLGAFHWLKFSFLRNLYLKWAMKVTFLGGLQG